MLAIGGCGGSDLHGAASESLDRLAGEEREAAGVLVELEQVSRAKDTATLCRRVYVYEFTETECRRGFARLLADEPLMRLEVEDVDLGADPAVAHALVTLGDDDGSRHASRYTFELVKIGGVWKVKLRD